MNVKQIVFAASVAVLFGTAHVVAHHSFAAEFDFSKTFKFTGKVTKVEWKNPHAFFYIDVTDETGKVVNWAMELGSPNGLIRAGWTRSTLKIGDELTVEGSKARDGSNLGNARTVILVSSGKRLFAASSQNVTP